MDPDLLRYRLFCTNIIVMKDYMDFFILTWRGFTTWHLFSSLKNDTDFYIYNP